MNPTRLQAPGADTPLTPLSPGGFDRKRQRGMGVFGFMFILVVLAGVGVMAMQALPTFLEYQNIVKAVNKAAADGPVAANIRHTFDKATQIDDIKSISGKDLILEKGVGDRTVVKFAYNKEIVMYAPLYLLIKYQGQSN